MADNEKPPIEIGSNAANLDTAMAILRYLGVIATSFPVLLAVVSRGDLAELFDWVRSDAAKPMMSAVAGLVLLLWGLWKTRHRAKQVVAVAADERVPADVAALKESVK